MCFFRCAPFLRESILDCKFLCGGERQSVMFWGVFEGFEFFRFSVVGSRPFLELNPFDFIVRLTQNS